MPAACRPRPGIERAAPHPGALRPAHPDRRRAPGRRRLRGARRRGSPRPAPARRAVLHARRGTAVGGGRRRAPVPAARLQRHARERRSPRVHARGGRARYRAPVRARARRRTARDGPAGPRLPRSARRAPRPALRRRGGHRAAGHLAGRAAGPRRARAGATRLPRRRPRSGGRPAAQRPRGHRRRFPRPPRPRHRTAGRRARVRAAGRRLRVRPAAHARGGTGPVCGARRPLPARARGGHGLRLRGLLRLRRRPARRRLPAPVRRRPGPRRGPAGGGAGALPVVDFCGLRLAHPIVNGSGTFDAIAARRAFGDAVLQDFPFAAFVSKTITLAPRDGNPPPRLYETAAGMVNSIGLPNKGLRGYLEHDLPELARLPVPLITNVMGSTAAEIAAVVEAVDARAEVDAIELNVSCPNVKTGLDIGADPRELELVVRRVRPLSAKPLIVKLTPNPHDGAAAAQAAEAGGADAVSLINTLRAYAPDPRTGSGPPRPWLGA